MAAKIAIIGDGAMATLCAIMLAENGCRVRLWSMFPDAARQLAATRRNERFFPDAVLPDSVEITADDAEALKDADLAVQAVPTQFIRTWWQRLQQHCPADLPICSVAKGVENKTLLRPTQVLMDVLDGNGDWLGFRRPASAVEAKSVPVPISPAEPVPVFAAPGTISRQIAVLSGPCIAPEVARKLPATVTVAGSDRKIAEWVQQLFTRPYFRVYTNDDLIGTELAGATKNVIAIAAGILDGLRAGDNAKAALLTRGLVEITRLGVTMGAHAETFAGLAGFGDLVTTCISPLGRNRSFGEAVGRGSTVQQALAATHSVVEGVATTQSVVELAARHHVEMPITHAVHDVIFSNRSPADAITDLMARPSKAERHKP